MTWPAPTLPPPATEPAPPESADERRRMSAVPAAAWIGVLGGALVLVAAAIVVASNWSSIGEGLRVAGLVAVTGALVAASERLREQVSTTAAIVAHVGTFLVTPVGIAAMSLFGFTWPVCLLIGGIVGAVATELQARRWSRITMHLAQVAALALAATGLAALTGTTAGLVAAIAAAGLLAAGGHLRASGLALLAVFSPALTALADVGIGSGTLARAGLVGDALAWSGPVVGFVAALVVGVSAQTRRNSGLMLAAAASPVLGVVTGLAAVEGPLLAWLTVPALVVVGTELAWWLLPDERRRDVITQIADGAAGLLVAPALLAPWLAADVELDRIHPWPWAVPAAATTFALALTVLRWHRADRPVVAAGIAALLSAAIATVAAFEPHPVTVAAVAVAATVVGALLSRRLHPAAIYVPAGWALLSIVAVEPSAGGGRLVAAAALLAGLTAVVVAVRARLAGGAGWHGWIEAVGIVAATAITATQFVDAHRPAAALVGALVAGLALVGTEARLARPTLVGWAAVGTVTLDAAAGGAGIADGYWFAWVAVTAAALLVTLRWRPAAFVASGSAVVTVAIASEALALTAEQFVGLAMIGTVVLTGIAFALQRRTPLDGAAIAAGVVLAVGADLDVDAGWVSAIWMVVGLQSWSYGLVTRRWWLRLLGAVTTLAAAISWWFTSGLHAWAVELIEPLDVTAGDLWMLAATAMALLAGWAARSTLRVSSWLAYTPGLAIGGLWLLSVEVERGTVWAIPTALTFGIVAAGVGAWRRLAAPLVGGTILTTATVFVASGSDLRAVPTWTWLAVGGLALLATAVVIERRGRGGPAALRALVERWD